MKKEYKIVMWIAIIGIGYLIWINRYAIRHKLGFSDRALTTGIGGNISGAFGQL